MCPPTPSGPRHYPVGQAYSTPDDEQHSREQWPLPEADGELGRRWTRPDIQAAVTVVGRRDVEHDIRGRPIDLYEAILIGANFTDADLRQATLRRADLAYTQLSAAILAHTDLREATLHQARDLDRADLTGATWSEHKPAPEGWKRDSSSGRLVKARTDSGPTEAN